MTDILITEVNSNAEGGDFFELYNHGTTDIDMTGWRWTDSAGTDIITFPAGTMLAAGQRLIVLSDADEAGFRTGWDLLDSLTVIALEGPGLGKGDGVVVVDGANNLIGGFNFGSADFSAPDSMGSHVISPSSNSGGGTAIGGHAGPAFGGADDSISAVWDGVSLEAPAYTAAVAGSLGAYVHTTDSSSVGSPGVAPAALPKVLITELNSNAAGGDFFELYNYGDSAIDLSGWKWVDDKADPAHEDAREFTGITELAAGARLIVVTDKTDIDDFRTKWNIDSSVQVITGTTEGPGLGGSGDAVVVFNANGKVATALNYKTTDLTASDGTVIESLVRADGNAVVSGHAGVAVGGSGNGVSAVWDGVDPTNPQYQAAVVDQDGAVAQADAAGNIGSPGAVPLAEVPPPALLITELNSNAEGGDFFELYNYGDTAIDLAGWKWVDDKADPNHEDAREFTGITELAVGARLVVITDGTDINDFRTKWNIDSSVQVITGTTEGPGLGGSGDAVVVFNANGKVATALNYKTTDLTASDGTVIESLVRADGNAVVSGHAGVAVGGSTNGTSAVWDGIDSTNPQYQAAVAGQDGAVAQADAAGNVGSPGAVRALATVMITEINSNAEGGDFFELYNHGSTDVDMTGWRWVDSAGSGSDIITFPGGTTLAAGERLIVLSDTDEAGFREGWDLPDDLTVIALEGAGLGKGDGVVVVDADNGLVAGFNYGTADFSAPASMGSHVIAPSTKAGGGTATGDHAGISFGGTVAGISAVWDGVSTAAPAYTAAVAGTLGAHVHATDGDSIGSPGGSFTLIDYSATTLTEAAANDGSIATTLTLTLRGDTFVNDLTGKFSVTNVPAGLTAVLTRTGDTTATLAFTGAATSHANARDVSNLTLSFLDGAFNGNNANHVFNSVKNNLVIDFNDSADDVSLAYSTNGLNESKSFDGSVSGEIAITLTGDTFTGNDGDSLLGTASLAHTPDGLTAALTRTNATTATLTFTGSAASHADAQDVNNLALRFLDGAFAKGNASAVAGNGTSDLKIDFSEPNTGTQEFKPNGQGSDASAALALDANYMVVGDDEANVLRIYDRKGGDALALANHGGAKAWDYGGALSISDELDLEGGTRIGDTLYFTGSSGNKKDGDDHPSRENLFSVQITGTGADTTFSGAAKLGNDNLESLLVAWDSNNIHGKGANYFGFAAASVGGVIPENDFGFSIEGLTANADANTLLLGFRAPQTGTTARDNAVIVELNLGVDGSLSGASLGAAHELNLGGRGIRSIEKSATGDDYLILAGPAGGASAEVTHDFRLFRWDGASATPTELDVNLDALRDGTHGSFETIVDVLSTDAGTWVQLLQDNGDTIWPGQPQISKDLPGGQQQFVGNWIQIGGDVSDTTGPALQNSSPADDAASASVGADLVLRFDEGIKRGSGDILIKKVSDGSIVATIDVTDTSQVSMDVNTVTINPATDLATATAYYVEAAPGTLTDHYGNAWAGLSGSAALNFATGTPQPPSKVLITEVNTNAGSVDFFELYNHGATAISLDGWKVDDGSATFSTGFPFPEGTTLAAGARLIVLMEKSSAEDIAAFRAEWSNLPDSVHVVGISGSGLGLGGGDAVVVFDANEQVVAAVNYGTANVTATDGTVIAPLVRADGEAAAGGHAGLSVGGSAASTSAVWDGASTTEPKYQAAVSGEDGAFASSAGIGSPGAGAVVPEPEPEPETPEPQPELEPLPGEPVLVEGSAGNDVIVIPDAQPLTTIITGGGNDVITGGAGIETVIVPVTLDEVLQLGVTRDNGTLVLNTPTGTVTLQDVERVYLSDGHLFATDIELPTAGSPGGHTGQVLALAYAGLGLLADESSTLPLSEWVREADELDSFSELAQAMIDFVRPGVSDQNLVSYLFWRATGEPANEEQLAFWVSQIGEDKPYETQGDLLAMVASLPEFTEPLVGLIGAPQVQLDASVFGL